MNRGELTTALLTALNSTGLPVGDGEPPKEGGWAFGTPNVGSHVPFVVLETGPTQTVTMTTTRDGGKDYLSTYALSTYTIRRNSCEDLSYRAREALRGVAPLNLTGFRVVRISVTTIGEVRKMAQVNPDVWAERDALEVYCVPIR